MSGVLTYKDRVVIERDELQTKLRHLHAFIEGMHFPKVEHEEQQRLMRQAEAMQAYLDILIDRIGNF
jgi:translation initiation factor IF-3